MPDDTGVRLNGGRPGAAEGPGAFRAALAKYGVAEPDGAGFPVVFDAGDVEPAHGHDEAALHKTHRRVTEAVGAVLELGLFPVGIGGGHDLTFPFVRAVANRNPGMLGLYFDPHLDVRETVGSGMPFRRLVEECGVSSLDNFGFNPMVNAKEHVEWFRSHGGRINRTFEPLKTQLASPGPMFASFDLDVLDASQAPGVSAMNPVGIMVQQAQMVAYACGRAPGVRCFDIMELCPPHDEQGRTARAAAHLFLSFLSGFAARSG
ncbi:MAG: formimidoylglutamase [Phycisphaerales bacterium]|nr:formimidoylglutamase [Phycisphaerales bacterium]